MEQAFTLLFPIISTSLRKLSNFWNTVHDSLTYANHFQLIPDDHIQLTHDEDIIQLTPDEDIFNSLLMIISNSLLMIILNSLRVPRFLKLIISNSFILTFSSISAPKLC